MKQLHGCQYWNTYCQNEAKYNQPHPETGQNVEVCEKHFSMNQAS
jgi:hypothetical protein